MTINFKKLSEKAVQPVRTTASGAGFNLTAAGITTEVNERGQLILTYHTGITVEIPEGYEATVRPSNSICAKTLRMLDAPSVVTTDEEIIVRFITTTDVIPAVYKEGEVIGQLVFSKKEDVEFVEVIDTTEKDTSAGEGDQSLPETEDESTNSDSTEALSGGEANVPEEA